MRWQSLNSEGAGVANNGPGDQSVTKTSPLRDRFFKHTTFCPNTGCWFWTGAINSHGYGKILLHTSTNAIASRVSFELFRGDIGSMHVLHKCDQRSCVNPEHLFLGTHTDNMRDAARKGRLDRSGDRNNRAVLTAADVRDIRQSPLRHYELARLYGVSSNTIILARKGTTWGHVR